MSDGESKSRRDPHESRIYSEFSHLYDRIFTWVFYPRIASTIRDLNIQPGARVLEVGVGTGLSLDAYPDHAEVVGIDLAPGMLEKARDKVRRKGWSHIHLETGDALDLSFDDDSFDYVMAFHVVSVVPDPARAMAEMHRVCRPNGTIGIINHFRSERPWVAGFVDRVDPVTRHFGWRTTLRFPELVGAAPVAVERRFKTSALSLFTVAIVRKIAEPTPARAAG